MRRQVFPIAPSPTAITLMYFIFKENKKQNFFQKVNFFVQKFNKDMKKQFERKSNN
jgi:hypothetical protein